MTAPKTLVAMVQAAKVKRCPKCISDGVAEPGDFLEVHGGIVFVDSQTYRGHWWYADTGEPYSPPPEPVEPAATPKAVSQTPAA